MLLTTDVVEFKLLYQKSFGIELSDEEAYENLTALVKLMELTVKPITNQQYMQYGNGEEDERERPTIHSRAA